MRAVKFRQAAFVYLHVAILYEAAAYEMWRVGLLPHTHLGPGWLWLILGGAVGFGVFLLLLRWQNPIFAQVIWAMHGLRLPPLIRGAFFPSAPSPMPPAFYITAIVVVTVAVNRAGTMRTPVIPQEEREALAPPSNDPVAGMREPRDI